ncbi:hypothetical protein MAPG_00034 [Magnaporthiopsis poae ATCC 64411]|uniref:Ras guanine nucleotide exchange factor A n=1 Tax=Magnaporthiopsis poae (strain ATCC 64411 / 73-15) TaxID=644358 RepID=A0A0C4DJX5_MAGP6|nr:hypothetical protein MAPG_00034 [Magnaporthiopsis poae ATCC 64411]
MDAVNIAVIGAKGVGKSAFIQRALSQTRPLPSSIMPVRLKAESGRTLFVTLIELDLEDFDETPGDQPIRWPTHLAGHSVALPRPHCALVLYDVTSMDSLRTLPQIMGALEISGLPRILVATKCDNPESARQVNTDAIPRHFPGVLNLITSANVPSTARESLNAIIKASFSAKRGGDKQEATLSRRRAASSAAHLEAPDYVNGRPLSEHSKHSRASSDLSLLRGVPPPGASDSYRGQSRSRSPRMDYPTTPQTTSSAFGSGADAPDDGGGLTVSSMLRTHGGVRLDTGRDTFVEDSASESYRQSDDIPILQRNDENFPEQPAKPIGVTFDDLVDRLLAPRMTRADNQFADIFLCLYRKFAPPSVLFAAIFARLEIGRYAREKKDGLYLVGIQSQLRIVEVIARWVQLYPGDFARSATRRRLVDLVCSLSIEPIFTAAAHQMRWYLDHRIVEDDDTGWAESDEPDEEPTNIPPDRRPSAVVDRGSGRTGGLNDSMSSLQIEDERGTRSDGRPPAQFQYHSIEDYVREAATMSPTSTLPLNKIRYHIFLDKNTDDIADEMTRIDWIMFSSIGIRDLVRDVSLTMEEKEQCRSLQNVSRMISHFNHLARWVANMILIRDKPKHRVLVLEKFVQIAAKLRVLNNYNGLAAVLAGLNSTSIYRLSQTWSLLSLDSEKRFKSLSKLMATEMSHARYRLAWENSPMPKIPYIPLHRRDLVSAEMGSRTFVGPSGDRINWKKFEVLGEVMLPLMRSQGTPYPNLKKDDGSRELILDCKMPIDEDDIYQRSVQVESASGQGESSRRRFPWLS